MKTATLEQLRKVVDAIADKNPLVEHVQWMLGGPLSDLLDANPDGFDREAFRKVLGLKPLNPPLLIPVSTAIVLETTTLFVARDNFVLNTEKDAPVKISYLGDNFKKWFLGKEEPRLKESTLSYGKLSRSSVDGPIIAALGGEEKAETTLTELYWLMEAQKNGENGALLTNGYANIFYIKDVNGVLRTVRASWGGVGWGVAAVSVTYPRTWDVDDRVFSRNS